MSNNYATVAKQVKELRDYIVDFYSIEVKKFSIKIIPDGNVAYTKLSLNSGSIIYISANNMGINHILAHEITHTQIPVSNSFFAEGFASLISCKIAGNCSPFWFPEKNLIEVIKTYFHQYRGLEKLVNNADSFDDFAKFSSRYAHIVAANFIEWLVRNFPCVTNTLINNIDIEPETILSDNFKCNLISLEQEWLQSIGVVYHVGLCSY